MIPGPTRKMPNIKSSMNFIVKKWELETGKKETKEKLRKKDERQKREQEQDKRANQKNEN